MHDRRTGQAGDGDPHRPQDHCGSSGRTIVFALGVKAVVLVLGALGMTNLWAAVFADGG